MYCNDNSTIALITCNGRCVLGWSGPYCDCYGTYSGIPTDFVPRPCGASSQHVTGTAILWWIILSLNLLIMIYTISRLTNAKLLSRRRQQRIHKGPMAEAVFIGLHSSFCTAAAIVRLSSDQRVGEPHSGALTALVAGWGYTVWTAVHVHALLWLRLGVALLPMHRQHHQQQKSPTHRVGHHPGAASTASNSMNGHHQKMNDDGWLSSPADLLKWGQRAFVVSWFMSMTLPSMTASLHNGTSSTRNNIMIAFTAQQGLQVFELTLLIWFTGRRLLKMLNAARLELDAMDTKARIKAAAATTAVAAIATTGSSPLLGVASGHLLVSGSPRANDRGLASSNGAPISPVSPLTPLPLPALSSAHATAATASIVMVAAATAAITVVASGGVTRSSHLVDPIRRIRLMAQTILVVGIPTGIIHAVVLALPADILLRQAQYWYPIVMANSNIVMAGFVFMLQLNAAPNNVVPHDHAAAVHGAVAPVAPHSPNPASHNKHTPPSHHSSLAASLAAHAPPTHRMTAHNSNYNDGIGGNNPNTNNTNNNGNNMQQQIHQSGSPIDASSPSINGTATLRSAHAWASDAPTLPTPLNAQSVSNVIPNGNSKPHININVNGNNGFLRVDRPSSRASVVPVSSSQLLPLPSSSSTIATTTVAPSFHQLDDAITPRTTAKHMMHDEISTTHAPETVTMRSAPI
jgi:hypothetical protein